MKQNVIKGGGEGKNQYKPFKSEDVILTTFYLYTPSIQKGAIGWDFKLHMLFWYTYFKPSLK